MASIIQSPNRPLRLSAWHRLILSVAIATTAMIVPICISVVSISAELCRDVPIGASYLLLKDRIGAEPGWHDGICGVRTDSNGGKSEIFWIGMSGEIVADIRDGRVARVEYFEIRNVTCFDFTALAWERLSRIRNWNVAISGRYAVFFTAVAVLFLPTFVFARRFLQLQVGVELPIVIGMPVWTFFFGDLGEECGVEIVVMPIVILSCGIMHFIADRFARTEKTL